MGGQLIFDLLFWSVDDDQPACVAVDLVCEFAEPVFAEPVFADAVLASPPTNARPSAVLRIAILPVASKWVRVSNM